MPVPEPILRRILEEVFPESDSSTRLISWDHPQVAIADEEYPFSRPLTIQLTQYQVQLSDDHVELNYEIQAVYRRKTNTIWYQPPKRLAQIRKIE